MSYSLANSSAQIGSLKKAVAIGRRTSIRVGAKAGNWLPGAESPSWLDGSMAGDFGFDPIGLGKDPARLQRFQEGEIINGRWAMLGAAGVIAVELLGQGNWVDAPNWAFKGESPTYFGVPLPYSDIGLITVIELTLMAGVEVLRGAEEDPQKRMYPGGAFNPMGFGKDESQMESLKLKEIKNGRLAMLAMLGFFSQAKVTGTGPLANLSSHLSNPMVNNCGNNHISVPAGAFGLPDFN